MREYKTKGTMLSYSDTATRSELEDLGFKVTVLRPSKRHQTAVARMWRNSAPRGAFQHGSVPGAASVKSGNKASKV